MKKMVYPGSDCSIKCFGYSCAMECIAGTTSGTL